MRVACPVCAQLFDESALNAHLDAVCLRRKRSADWSFLGKRPQAGYGGSGGSGGAANKAADAAAPRVDGNPDVGRSANEPLRARSNAQTGDVQADVVSASRNDAASSTTAGTGASSTAPDGILHSSPARDPPRTAAEASGGSGRARPSKPGAPLAERMRPQTFADYIGQEKVISMLQALVRTTLPSLVLWGPSGTGKTTLARVLAHESRARFVELSAPSASTQDVRRVVEESRADKRLLGRPTLLFLDEIHRFTRAQQDSLLQAVERGDFVLVGATTENPSFRLGGALLSRTKVVMLGPLSEADLVRVCARADEQGLVPQPTLQQIAAASSGDARKALNMLETALALRAADPDVALDAATLFTHVQNYDQKADNHYDLISAFHKSIRGSHADASLYYLMRMLGGGEDPVYVARRLVRIASEDIGLADDSCLPFALSTLQAVQALGMPECDVHLAHCAVKFARAPKSVEVYKAMGLCRADIQSRPQAANAPVPLHLRNAPTRLMKDVGYGEGYKYNPDYAGEVQQEYMPPELDGSRYLGVFKASK